MDRILIYTCANDKYTHFIPLLILTYGLYNDNVDFEIGINLSKLPTNEEKAINYLRERFPNSKINIKYNFFSTNGSYGIVNQQQCLLGTVRFLTEPEIKDKYTYICDIDIVCLVKNFYKYHIDNMNRLQLPYSNMVRSNSTRLTGMHFTESDSYYPIPNLDDINLLKNDEEVLHDIVKKRGININYETTYRPIFGVHFSFNRPTVEGDNNIPSWCAEEFKEEWRKLTETSEYQFIYPFFDKIIKDKIHMLEEFYKKH